MGSKLRLSGKGTRGTATLSEKEQIDLAIALSLQQQQGKEHLQTTEQELAAVGAGGHDPRHDQQMDEPGVAPAAANAHDKQDADGTRKRRAAALRRTYALEESDSEGSPDSSAGGRQGADDYKPESSASGSDSDDDSDFAGDDDSDDEAPSKKRKAEAAKGKKGSAKAPAGRKKPGATDKATGPAAAAKGTKPPAARASGAAVARGRTAAPGPAPAAPVARPPFSKPTATARPATVSTGLSAAARPREQDNGRGSADAGAPADMEEGPQDIDICGSEGRRSDDAACGSDLPPCSKSDADAAEMAAVAEARATVSLQAPASTGAKVAAVKTLPPKATDRKVVAAPGTAATKAPPLGKPAATVKGPAQVTPTAAKQPPKPLVLTNRATPSAAAASAPFKPPIGSSGGASGIKASTPLMSGATGAMTYRVPGLRRPGGSSGTKKPS
ncbi:hypothetical protein PLESTB_001462100 [Pleodorina starrii]|uniref:Uncharacterized protein n=1 Tax=Pleodorina starrii TaxID=330485 RepID=A0A9W6BVK0_9CHLO|nr:hypothetical protein PLESTM_001680200 [Pleodorina starrii]GLC59209.1 hypothetical protein PLESTB_001462100 [Pleodorina starrii]